MSGRKVPHVPRKPLPQTSGNLPQADPDRLPREAENHLRTVENTLRSTNGFEHHHNARISVGEALRELRTALRIN
jgi:hypothetical protein